VELKQNQQKAEQKRPHYSGWTKFPNCGLWQQFLIKCVVLLHKMSRWALHWRWF
jgi:hypothetical protein